MDGEGSDRAFCFLLWAANGGAFNAKGEPRFQQELIRGNCTRPYDCGECALMQQELEKHPSGEVTWVCPDCVSTIVKKAREQQRPISIPGHFTEGYCQYQECVRPRRTVETGVTQEAGFSRFLQLIIGPVNR